MGYRNEKHLEAIVGGEIVILSKNQKAVLDYCIKNKYDLQGRFYTLNHLAGHIKPLAYDDVFEVCSSLVEKKLLMWGDNQHTAIRLTSDGRDYKELHHLESREVWKNRIWGFITGIVSGVLIGYFSALLVMTIP